MDRWRRGPKVPEHGGTLTGVWPSAQLGPHWSSGGGVATGRRWGGARATKEGKECNGEVL
jgi:hypothetical protein